MKRLFTYMLVSVLIGGCTSSSKKEDNMAEKSEIQQKVEEYASYTLTTDMRVLTDKEKEMIPLLLETAKIMDELFWMQAFGDKEALLTGDLDEYTQKFIEINY